MSNGSRYRAIHCLIWNDDKFPFMSDYGKLIFFHLLTTPFSTPFGCYKAGKASLLEESRIDSKGFSKGFAEGLKQGLFKYDERTLTIFLPNFLKHNKPANPNVVKKWSKIFKEIPAGPLKSESYDAISACCKGLGKAFTEAFTEAFGEPPSKGIAIQEQEQEQEQEQDIEDTNVSSCPEPCDDSRPQDEEEPIIKIPLNAKDTFFPVFQNDIDEWQETFPGINVLFEIKKCRQWNIDRPTQRKTIKGIRRHISAWMGKAQDRARQSCRLPPRPPSNQPRLTARQQYMKEIGDELIPDTTIDGKPGLQGVDDTHPSLPGSGT